MYMLFYTEKKILYLRETSKMKSKNIDVVLTLYKRPDVLLKQLMAIRSQTVTPHNIFLYQDGLDSYYEIILKDDIKKYFSDIMISNNNKGVWERFKYAKEIVKAEYVCIFDDDTIPGEKWFENCLDCMEKEEGIYGTNGILLNLRTNYPFGNDTRIGWNNPNEKIAEVDFVGHSWFLKTEWLSYMFDDRDNMDEYKYVGEDMYLSVKCLEHGIHTFVPVHPYSEIQLWGSIPRYGEKYGVSSLAISCNSNNYTAMNKVLKILKNKGWRHIAERNISVYRKSLDSINIDKKKINQMVIEKFKSLCENVDHIFIYGAGKTAKIFFDYISVQGYALEAFIVTDVTNEKCCQYCGRPIFEVDNYNFGNKKNLMILGISEFYHEEIRGYMKSVENIRLYPEKISGIPYDDLLQIFSSIGQ